MAFNHPRTAQKINPIWRVPPDVKTSAYVGSEELRNSKKQTHIIRLELAFLAPRKPGPTTHKITARLIGSTIQWLCVYVSTIIGHQANGQ
jgi:hypothetical protein